MLPIKKSTKEEIIDGFAAVFIVLVFINEQNQAL